MSPLFISIAVFICATAAVIAVVWVVSDLFGQSQRKISRRVNLIAAEHGTGVTAGSRLFDKEFTSQEKPNLWRNGHKRVETLLTQAGLKISPAKCLCSLIVLGLATGACIYMSSESLALSVLAGGGSLMMAIMLLLHKQKARTELVIQQMPEAFELMARTVRAGQTVLSAMRLAGENLESPLADHFRVCCEQQSLGIPFDRAVEDFAANVNVLECRMFCVALLLQRQAGGNPAEVMEKLARVIRRRLAMQNKVKALTSEGRMQATALTLLPVAAFILIYVIDPEYCQKLLDVSWLFWGTVASMIIGGWWIRKIISIEY